MNKQERLYIIRRQLDLLTYRADHLNPGPRRDVLVRRIEEQNVEYALLLA
ncbi:MAG: hypothetical protein ACHP78_10215 [Terriglobales bacterium]